MPPLITALIDTYNHERFIEQAIVSTLEQGLSASEMDVLVVDDGSTDGTSEIVRKFAPRVRYLRKPNGGQASAFNVGILQADGQIVVTLDGDDWWAPGKVRRQLDVLESDPKIGIVGHGYYEADSEGRIRATILPGVSGLLGLESPSGARRFGLLRGFFGAPRMAIRRWLLERILPIPEALVIEADEYIFTLAPALAPAYLIDEPFVYYRLHAGNLFQSAHLDERGKRRKSRALSDLAASLPARLAEFGMSTEISHALLEPLRLEAARTRLSLDGGSRKEVFQVERDLYRLSYRKMNLGYHAFRAVTLLLTMLLPPLWFYRFRGWYSESDLRRLRTFVATATPSESVVEVRSDLLRKDQA